MQTDLKAESAETHLNYIKTQIFDKPEFPNNQVTVYSKFDATAATPADGIVTEVIKNEALAKTFNSIMVRWTPTKSIEAFEGGLSVKG